MAGEDELEVVPELAELGYVEPPPGAMERARTRARRTIRRRAQRVVAVAAAFSAVAGAMAIAGLSLPVADATPDVDEVVDRHVELAELRPVAAIGPADEGFPVRTEGGLELVALERVGKAAHALYRGELVEISVFRSPGELRWDRLPDSGQRVRIGEIPAWQLRTGR